MSRIIKPEIRKTSEIRYHYDNAPGERYVFVDKKLFPESEFYVIGRRIEFVPEDQEHYVDEHRHNCKSYYLFIGDNEDLSGLKAEIDIEGNKKVVESPGSVVIPEKILHTYKLIEGKGWFINIVLKPDYNSSLFEGEAEEQNIDVENIYKKAIRQDKKPAKGERPISSELDKVKNPQRYIFIDPNLYEKPEIYSAIHKIVEGRPFAYSMVLHKHRTDEAYVLISRKGEKLKIKLIEPEKKETVESPSLIYHGKGEPHRYEYLEGEGILLVLLKEKILGEGYKFIGED